MQPSTPPIFTVDEGLSGGRRTGTLAGDGWRLRTPAVVPVGPLATAGSLTADDLASCGVRALGVDWVRLWLRPGIETIGTLGGLRRVAGWSGATIAGPAAWAFANAAARVSDREASVISPVDGSTLRLTPEAAVEAQVALGLDVVAALDWPDAVARPAKAGEVGRLRLAWAAASLAAGAASPPAANGAFVLASVPLASSAEVIRALGELPFGGYVLEVAAAPRAALGRALSLLPASALRVVDWRGGIAPLAEIVSAGVDVVRLTGEADRAREGVVLADGGEMSAVDDAWLDDPGPLEAGCGCPTCRRFSRAYIRHLYVARELLGQRLVEAHNLAVLARAAQIDES